MTDSFSPYETIGEMVYSIYDRNNTKEVQDET